MFGALCLKNFRSPQNFRSLQDFGSLMMLLYSTIHLTIKMKTLMQVRMKHWYCYLKRVMGLDKDDDVFGNNPFVIL